MPGQKIEPQLDRLFSPLGTAARFGQRAAALTVALLEPFDRRIANARVDRRLAAGLFQNQTPTAGTDDAALRSGSRAGNAGIESRPITRPANSAGATGPRNSDGQSGRHVRLRTNIVIAFEAAARRARSARAVAAGCIAAVTAPQP